MAPDPVNESFQAYLEALAAMQKAFLRELFRLIQAGFRVDTPDETVEALVPVLLQLVREWRGRTHDRTSRFLTQQARIAGGGTPDIAADAVGYSEQGLRTVLASKMRANPTETWVALAGPLYRAVNNVARETIIASSEITVQQHPAAFPEVQVENVKALADEVGVKDFDAEDAWDALALYADEAEARVKLDELRPDDAEERSEWQGIESREGVYERILTGDVDEKGRRRKPFAWARVLVGAQNCHFCIMLASRGPVYASKESAMFTAPVSHTKGAKKKAPISRLRADIDRAKKAQRFHDFCDCEIVPVFDRSDWPGKEQYEAAKTLWDAATVEAEKRTEYARERAKAIAEATGRKPQRVQRTDPASVLKEYSHAIKTRGWAIDFDPLKPRDEKDTGWVYKNWEFPYPTTEPPIPRGQTIRYKLTDKDKLHIWEGEENPRKGGHRPGAGRANKTEFPSDWSRNEAMQAVQRAIDTPDAVFRSGDATVHAKIVDDVLIHAKFHETSEGTKFTTAFPDRGVGVYANLMETGVKLRAPLVKPEGKGGKWHEIV